jgi:hypothetical protein
MAILRKSGDPDSEWGRCPACAEILPTTKVRDRQRVCPGCGYHYPLGLGERMALLLDEGSFEPQDASLVTTDVLRFKGARRYKSQLAAARKATGSAESVCAGEGRLEGRPVAAAFVDGDFLEGSLGCVAMERLCRVFRRAESGRMPALCARVSVRRLLQPPTNPNSDSPNAILSATRLMRARAVSPPRWLLIKFLGLAPMASARSCGGFFACHPKISASAIVSMDVRRSGPPAADSAASRAIRSSISTGLMDVSSVTSRSDSCATPIRMGR